MYFRELWAAANALLCLECLGTRQATRMPAGHATTIRSIHIRSTRLMATPVTNGTTANEGSTPEIGIDTETLVHLAVTYGVPALKVVIILLVAWVIAGWMRRLTTRSMEKAKIDVTISRFTGNMVRWGLLLLSIIAVLGIFGVPTASFVAVVGALGLAIGLALQGTLGNAAAGFLLLIFRPFRVGDVITAAGITGKVYEIELFSTAVDTPDNRRIVLPNGAVFGATIENVTYHSTRRVDVPVGVSYGANIEATRQALTTAVEATDKVLQDPAPVIMLTDLGASSVDWVVRAWVNTSDFWTVKEALTASIKNSLDAADISIPYPQMDIHVKAGDAAAFNGDPTASRGAQMAATEPN